MAKGVRVSQLVTSIKEHVTVMNKHGQPHTSAKDIMTKKHNFHSRSSPSYNRSYSANTGTSVWPASRAGQSSTGSAHPVSVPVSRSGSHSDLTSLANQNSTRLNFEDHPALASGSAQPSQSRPIGMAGQTLGGSTTSSASQSRVSSRPGSPERVFYGRNVNDPEYAGNIDDDGTEDVDVDAVINIPIPMVASPGHSIEVGLKQISWSVTPLLTFIYSPSWFRTSSSGQPSSATWTVILRSFDAPCQSIFSLLYSQKKPDSLQVAPAHYSSGHLE